MTTATAPLPKLLGNRYEVLRELGRGSMGVVYDCRALATGGRVAVKVVRVDGSTGFVRARAQREQFALARLQSPHIVQLLDLFEEGEAQHFVYQLVDGSTLDRIGKVSVADALQWHHEGITLFITARTRVGPYRLASARPPYFAIHHGEPDA